MPSTLLLASRSGERHRLQDPARALRLAIRNYDEPKLARLTEWLLNGVPLLWDEQYPLARCRVIRGRVAPGDDGFAFAIDEATGVVSEVRRPDEVPQMSKGDRVVTVDAVPLGEVPLGAAVEPESVVELGLWPRGEMAALRRRLAQRSLDDGVVEVAKLACTGDARREAGAASMLSTLLLLGAKARARDTGGMAAVHWACSTGSLDVVKALLHAGASLNAPSGHRETPLAEVTPPLTLTLALALALALAPSP